MAFPQLLPSFGEAVIVCVKRRRRHLRWLHAAGHLLQLGRFQAKSMTRQKGVVARRSIQRQKLGQRLLETKSEGWIQPSSRGSLFWNGLRWGGAGFVIGWWLKS